MEEKSSSKNLLNGSNLTDRFGISAGVAAAQNMLLLVRRTAYGRTLDYDDGDLTRGEIAILRFMSALELIEGDLWQQYEELGGVTYGPQNAYQLALGVLDSRGSERLTSSTMDEIGHSATLNTYLSSVGANTVDFDRFRSLRGSWATGAHNVGRLTNLKHLDIDTSWYIRYRKMDNPSLSKMSLRTAHIPNQQTLPRTDLDFEVPSHVQTIANAAVFHFAYIEYLVSSFYATVSHNLKRANVLLYALSLGGDEVARFIGWMGIAAKAVQGGPFCSPSATLDAAEDRAVLPNYDVPRSNESTPQLFPIPSQLSKSPACLSLIGTRDIRLAGSVATANRLIQNGLFVGQTPEFVRTLLQLADDADRALAR